MMDNWREIETGIADYMGLVWKYRTDMPEGFLLKKI